MFYTKFIVHKHERALLFRDGDFVKFLEPGVHRFVTILHAFTVERFDISTPLFGHRLQDFLVEKYPRQVERYFDVIKTGENEIAVVCHDDEVTLIMAPATRHLFVKGVYKIRVERFEIANKLDVDTRLAKRLLATNDAMLKAIADKAVYARVVPDGQVGLLYIDGELTRTLAPGFHAFLAVERAVTVALFDTRVQTLEVSGQEILTKDKVALRIILPGDMKELLGKELETLEKITEKIGNISVYGDPDFTAVT